MANTRTKHSLNISLRFPRTWPPVLTLLICFLQAGIAGAEQPDPHVFFVQITDTHWSAPGTLERSKKIVERINALPMPVACVVHTGDIMDDSIEDASAVQAGLAAIRKLKAPLHFVPGNHDILPLSLPGTIKAYTRSFGPLISTAEYQGMVFVMVYTEPLAKSFPVPEYDPFAAVETALKQAGNKPVILFHHSPSVEDFYNNAMHEGWPKAVRDRWTSLLNAYPVKAVIAGHFHRDEHHWLNQVPLYVCPPVSGKWGRQATFRIYEYAKGKLGYRTQYIEE